MLIAALNKKFTRAFLLFALGLLDIPSQALAHGDGGLDYDETSVLYTSMMHAMREAGDITARTLDDLEVKYHTEGRPLEDAQIVEFMNERIRLDAPAFAKLLDRSIDIFRARLEKECSHCYFEKRVIEHPSFRAKVFNFLKNYFIHYARILKTAFVNPRSMVTTGVGIGGKGLRLFAIHGPLYLVYTAITEGIESTIMGPAHWACTFFQALYFPAAYLGHQVWNPLLSSGHGFALLKRLGVSSRSVFAIAKYKSEMRRLMVESATGNYKSVLTRKDYRKYISGLEHHIEHEMDYKKFWGEIYRNFHAPETRPLLRHARQMDLQSDLDKIFYMETPFDEDRVSEPERFYIAVKHADGLKLMLSMLENMSDDLYVRGKYSAMNYFRVSSLLGRAGAHLTRYENLLFTGALSPRDNIALQFHQSVMAERALDSIQKFLISAESLVKPSERIDQETIKWMSNEIGSALKAEAKALKKSVRTRVRFNQADAENCAALLSKIR